MVAECLVANTTIIESDSRLSYLQSTLLCRYVCKGRRQAVQIIFEWLTLNNGHV